MTEKLTFYGGCLKENNIVWDRITSSFSAGTGDDGEKGEFMKALKVMLAEIYGMFPEVKNDNFLSNGSELIQDNEIDYRFTVLPSGEPKTWMCVITAETRKSKE